MQNTYFFQQSRPHLPEIVDHRTATRSVRAFTEARARGRLPRSGPGRVWMLVGMHKPEKVPDEISIRDTQIVPVLLDGDPDAIVGFAEIRSDGVIDLSLDKVRMKEPCQPEKGVQFKAVSVSINYQGLDAHHGKV